MQTSQQGKPALVSITWSFRSAAQPYGSRSVCSSPGNYLSVDHYKGTGSVLRTTSHYLADHIPRPINRRWIHSLLLTFFSCFLLHSTAIQAQPIVLNGEGAIPVELNPIEAPKAIFLSTAPQHQSRADWYQLDVTQPSFATDDWLLVFRQVPHSKLDVFAPANGGYRLVAMGLDSGRNGIKQNTLELNTTPGQISTFYLRHNEVKPNRLLPELWPAMAYFETLSNQDAAISSAITLLIVALVFLFVLTMHNRTRAMYLLISHMLASTLMLLMWDGDIFRNFTWLGNPGHWLMLVTTGVIVTAIACYRSLTLLPVYSVNVDRLVLSLTAMGFAIVVYAITASDPVAEPVLTVAATSLLLSLALVVIASGYCLYNNIRPARLAFPASLILLGFLSWSWSTEMWPRSMPTFNEVFFLSLHGALLPLFYWYGHYHNLQHSVAINAVAPTSSKRRVFESALRQHLQTLDAPMPESEITQRILATCETVIPEIPAIMLQHQGDQWQVEGNHLNIAANLRKQLPDIENDLMSVIASGSGTRINFKDRFGTIFWLFPLSIEPGKKIILALIPMRQHRNANTWQTACDISSHAATLAQSNRQSLFWQQQASLDSLTGLLNRRAFCEESDNVIHRQRTSHNPEPCCALFMDIDNFKQFNDQLGHNTGDLILKNTASLCKKALRQQDILGRFGGEEFVALLPNTEPWQAFRVAERIRYAVMNAKLCGPDNQQPITISIGVAAMSSTVDSLEKLMADADKAMYRAKEKGKNKTAISAELTDVRLPHGEAVAKGS
ncbi:diguanylate cyclase [uncultured Endozoicomonas sp.]|uniref:diguanylate cyclase n=1 Tax=uncultured Endozoicomonas sp. TaxID=432652 RepID=UPI00262F604D|nr:diguanylate cyclase [uncultured Endozoicomonas sp.]